MPPIKKRSLPVNSGNATNEDAADMSLYLRMNGPQRHRLLQGFPMRSQMRPADPTLWHALADVPSRPLLLGVLPHPFCNPRVEGCGFCTFPHQKFHADTARTLTEDVINELQHTRKLLPSLPTREVQGLYFGGATANLTPADAFERLCRALRNCFEIRNSEVTLEGVPAYFSIHDWTLLKILRNEIPARQHRISMGVQTFDPAWIEKMGRSAFGDRETVEQVVQYAQARGLTSSLDLLINLPTQPIRAMLDDVRMAAAMGVDQICVYNLVLDRGLNTPWSRDPQMLARRTRILDGESNWIRVREELLELGYLQSTLTNFERREVHGTDRAFSYERNSFHPERFDALGLGPAAISTFTNPDTRRGVKWLNHEDASEYSQRVRHKQPAAAKGYHYDSESLRVWYLTRKISLGEIPIDGYRAFCGDELEADFGDELKVIEAQKLIARESDRWVLTPAGMFYADSIAGLLAERIEGVRRMSDRTDFMG